MAMQAILETLDDVPEAIRGEYKKAKVKDKDGNEREVFAIDLVGTDGHPDVSNLRNAFDRQKVRNTELQQQLSELRKRVDGLPDDFSPETIQQLNDEITRLKESGEKDPKAAADARKQLEQQIDNLKKRITELEKERDDAVSQVEGELENVLVGDGLTKALVEVGVEPKFMKAVSAMLRGQVKVEKEDGKRQAVVNTNLGPVPIEKFVKDWAASDEGKEFVKKPTGGGANGGGGGKGEYNPWAADNANGVKPNLTEQGKIIRSDKPKAERMMRSAGMSDEQIQRRLNAS